MASGPTSGSVTWALAGALGGTLELQFGVDIRLSEGASLDARLNLTTQGGQVAHVTFLVGISF